MHFFYEQRTIGALLMDRPPEERLEWLDTLLEIAELTVYKSSDWTNDDDC